MSLPIPLAVTLETARGVYRVTKDLRDLSFRSVVPGGFASASISLDRPLDIDPVDIAYYGTMTISDRRHGGVVWQGRLEDPSRGAGSDGRIWDLAAVGPSAHASDRAVPLVYVYRDLAHWQRTAATKEAGRSQQDERDDETPALMFHAPEGSSWTSGDSIRMTSRWVLDASMNLSRVNWNMVAGKGDSDWAMEGYVWFGTPTQVRSATLTTTPQGLDARVVGTDWTHPQQRLELRLRNINDETPAGDTWWARFWDLRVRSTLYDASGSEMTSASDYTADTVLASEIVADLLGRLLDQYDGATADIDTTTTTIEQLAYPDGITPREVLTDLEAFEPGHYWAAWEKTANDTHRFEYVEWPTTVAYEANADDGYSSSGSAGELYNEVSVRWRDPAGRTRTTTRSQTVDVLDDAGLTRTAVIDLGDELASSNNAANAGDNFLSEHGTPPNAGSLTVARPILDHDRGRLVQPWEITPGKLIRVRGVQPRVDALNPGGRDGVTVFRVVATEYDAASASATLELDSKPLTVTNALAKLPHLTGPFRRRRR